MHSAVQKYEGDMKKKILRKAWSLKASKDKDLKGVERKWVSKLTTLTKGDLTLVCSRHRQRKQRR